MHYDIGMQTFSDNKNLHFSHKNLKPTDNFSLVHDNYNNRTRQQLKNGASSKLQRLPVAPRGCPLEMSPPLGFITHFPPYVLSPLSTSSPPFPEIINKSLIRVCHAAFFYLHM